MQTSQISSDGTTTRAYYDFSRGAIKHQQPVNYRADVSGEIVNPRNLKSGISVGIRSVDDESNITLTNNAKISDAKIGIDAFFQSTGDINIINNGEIWNVKKYGIRAVHKGSGDINVTLDEDIKLLNTDSPIDGRSDVFMKGGTKHKLVLKPGIILDAVSFGVTSNDFLESKWDVDSGATQTKSFEGFVDNGAYRYILDHEVVEEANTWSFYRELTPTAVSISNQLKDLANIRVDRDPGEGFWAHQNSLRSSDDSVHFGFNTHAVSFMGGGLVASNSISPNLSASLVKGMSMSSSIGLDYHFDVMGFSVSPQMELAWTRFDFDDFTGPGSTGKVSLEDGDIITSRFSLLFDGDYIYGGVNLHTSIDGKTSANISGVSISSEQDGFSVDGLLGFSYDWSEDYETYGELFMHADEVRANLGVRIDF